MAYIIPTTTEKKKMNTNKSTWKSFVRHFKSMNDNTSFIPMLYAEAKFGTLSGEQKDGVISITFKIQPELASDRKESLKHLVTFVDEFNKQKNKIDGFMIKVVTTDFSILGDVIQVQLVHKFSNDYTTSSNQTYNMTFNIEGISAIDLPYIYTERVRI